MRAVRSSLLLLVLLALAGALLWARLGRETPARDELAARAATHEDAGDADGEARGFLLLDGGRKPNVLLLTVDTLRADHLSTYRPEFAGLTPAIDRLAARGTLFLRTTAPAPATRPSLAALHSGSYPHRTGVISNHAKIRRDALLLAQILRRSGYVTAAFYGNALLDPKSGLRRGFGTYVSFVVKDWSPPDREGIARALEWLDAQPREPWLLWIHLMGPHGPYNSAPLSPLAAGLPDPLPDVELTPSKSNYGLGPIVPHYQIMRVKPRASVYRRRYRDEVAYLDTHVERLMAELDARGLTGSTVFIFTSDHGEGLGEHNYYFQHGWLANEPSVHVPMIWSLPGRIREGHRVAATTSLVDVLPTLLAGLDLPDRELDGRNLGPALAGREMPDGHAFVRSAYANRVTAVRHGAFKLVHTPPPPNPLPKGAWRPYYALRESWELYDLERDPAESRDLSAERRRTFERLRRRLIAWERRNGVARGSGLKPEIDAKTLERLRSLGYAD